MSDLNHILYTSISLILTTVAMVFLSKKQLSDKTKTLILKISALLTVIIHFSSLYVDYFSGNEPSVEQSMLLPLYPCNVAMWLLLIVAFYKKKEGKLFEFLAMATFYLGVFGGIIGITFNEIYINNPNLLDWGVLKGMLSHSTMLFGCIYLLVGGYVKIGVSNMLNVLLGLILLVVDGALIILLHYIFGLDLPNSMYLLRIPFESMPWLNVVTIGLIAMAIIFIATALYEQFALKKEDRWYTKLKAFIDSKKSNKKSEV